MRGGWCFCNGRSNSRWSLFHGIQCSLKDMGSDDQRAGAEFGHGFFGWILSIDRNSFLRRFGPISFENPIREPCLS